MRGVPTMSGRAGVAWNEEVVRVFLLPGRPARAPRTQRLAHIKRAFDGAGVTGGKALAAYMTERRVPTPSGRGVWQRRIVYHIAGLFARRLREPKILDRRADRRGGGLKAERWDLSAGCLGDEL